MCFPQTSLDHTVSFSFHLILSTFRDLGVGGRKSSAVKESVRQGLVTSVHNHDPENSCSDLESFRENLIPLREFNRVQPCWTWNVPLVSVLVMSRTNKPKDKKLKQSEESNVVHGINSVHSTWGFLLLQINFFFNKSLEHAYTSHVSLGWCSRQLRSKGRFILNPPSKKWDSHTVSKQLPSSQSCHFIICHPCFSAIFSSLSSSFRKASYTEKQVVTNTTIY